MIWYCILKAKSKRRDKERELEPIDIELWKIKLDVLNNQCQMCKVYLSDRLVECDHIIPITKGGTNHIDNLQPLCKPCNSSKGNKIIAC